MYSDFLLPSAANFTIVPHEMPQACPTATYGDKGWTEAMLWKLGIVASLSESGEPFIISDADVILNGLTPDDAIAELGDNNLVGQDDFGDICCGFMVIRPCRETCAALRDAEAKMRDGRQRFEQIAVNHSLRAHETKRAVMSSRFICLRTVTRSCDWDGDPSVFDNFPPDAKMFHANWTKGTDKKIAALKMAKHKMGHRW